LNNKTTLEEKPYGSWKSDISPTGLVENKIQFDFIKADSNQLYWSESRPAEQGRCVIVNLENPEVDLIPVPYSAKSRVHEYGGGSFCFNGDTIYFVNEKDQQIYSRSSDSNISQLTHEIDCRFADLEVNTKCQSILAVCERHAKNKSEPVNSIVLINTKDGKLSTLAHGHDFFAFPRFNSAANQIAWISWDHPNMPWDQSSLHKANFDPTTNTIGPTQNIVDCENTSVFQPEFSADGTLYYVSDQSGWWNLYSEKNTESPIIEQQSEFGLPVWVFGLCTYRFISDTEIACIVMDKAQSSIKLIDLHTSNIKKLDLAFSDFYYLYYCQNKLFTLAVSPQEYTQLIQIDIQSSQWQCIKSSSQSKLDPAWISLAKEICFPTSSSDQAYGFYYAPKNPNQQALANEKPPLLVMSHGGPTTYTTNTLNLKIQFWTSRGFAVLDVNYRGSTGFGRHYRNKLLGQWGIADVQDCENGAKYLADNGLVDPDRLLIRGGSAGGYTTLCALTFGNTFKAGASYFGISDLMVLASDTHKFESRYCDRLIGPLPESKHIYQERSPIHYVDQINCPIIFLQGLKDEVVPPAQSEKLVNALRDKKLPVAYITYENERHGFRDADVISHSIQSELYFYQRVLNLDTDETFSIDIENL